MRSYLALLLLAYLIAAFLDGIRGVVLLLAIGLAGSAVMFGTDALMRWRQTRTSALHQHAWRTMTYGRGFIRWQRCICGAERMVKGRP
jgi:hypothetical protein